MPNSAPRVIVLAGPNGAGKSTLSRALVLERFGIRDFVNADTIARGLSAFDPDHAAVTAGRVMLGRLRELSLAGRDMAFETTLASRSYARWIHAIRSRGYHSHLVFVALPSAEAAFARVRQRIASGGHAIPEEVVVRRFRRGLENFFGVYRALADEWEFVDNCDQDQPRIICNGRQELEPDPSDAECWRRYAGPSDLVRERVPEGALTAHPPVSSIAEIERAAARALREALLRHKLLGQSIVVWRDGAVVEIPPEQILVPTERVSPAVPGGVRSPADRA